ncbi:MAG: hypothetical protein ABJG78_03665 [Cyclobacteriaceae bacterium]
MNEDSTLLSEWIENLTTSSFINILMLVAFGLLITWMVARTFRGKSDV